METNTTLQNTTVHTPATFNFKSAALNAYSRQIADIGRDMASKNIELAKILGRIKTEEAYKEDGFKSVSDYAEQTFSIKKAQAYQLANVGARFYNSDSPTAQKVVSLLTPANMAEIANMEDKDIDAAIESGVISKDSTQKQLRETAKAVKDAGKATIEKMHNIHAIIVDPVNGFCNRQVERMTLSVFEHTVLQGEFGFENVISKKFAGDSKSGTVMVLADNGGFAKVMYELPSPAKAEKTSKKSKYTVAELQAMLQAAISAETDEDEDEDEENEEG